MFKHTDLHIPKPDFDSALTKAILRLDYLRHIKLGGTTPRHIFFQLKEIFHFLESLGSARIEGNRTTLAEYIETKISPEKNPTESIREIQNNERVMTFIEENVHNKPIDHAFIQQCQKIIVDGLSASKEGDSTPGEYRNHEVQILKSNHTPPMHLKVKDYMDELIQFILAENEPQYDLLKTAISHHRFAWIHPFGNGNGRTVRALTYAMLIKQGFNLQKGRIVNPTAVFCSNRDQYYDMLERADTGDSENILSWCEYVLTGLQTEVEKIDKLTDYAFLKPNILEPAIKFAFERRQINEREQRVLFIAINTTFFQASDIKSLFNESVAHTEISRFIRSMKERKLIKSITPNSRKYTIEIANGHLLRGVMKALDEKGFLPLKEEVDLV